MRPRRQSGGQRWSCAVPLALAICALPRAAAQTEPVFRATTEMVLVPASVLDKQGQPVTGLKLEDFELRVDGKPVRISALNEISGPPAAASGAARPLPPGAVTNIAPVEASRSWVVLLVDFINTSVGDRMELRNQLLKFLSKDLRQGQQVAIYALSSSLMLLHPFTADTKPLIEAASCLVYQKGAPPPPANASFLGVTPASVVGMISAAPGSAVALTPSVRGADAGIRTDIESFLLWSQWRQYVFATHSRAATTLSQFRQLANSFAGVAGKKSVLWLTGDASPLNPSLMNQMSLSDPSSEPLRVEWRELAATYEALSGAGVSLFPVDIRGITNPGLANPGETPSHAEFMENLAQPQPGAGAAYSSATSRRQVQQRSE